MTSQWKLTCETGFLLTFSDGGQVVEVISQLPAPWTVARHVTRQGERYELCATYDPDSGKIIEAWLEAGCCAATDSIKFEGRGKKAVHAYCGLLMELETRGYDVGTVDEFSSQSTL